MTAIDLTELPELHTGLVTRLTDREVCLVESDGKTFRLIQCLALLLLPSGFMSTVAYILYAGGAPLVLFVAATTFGVLLSFSLFIHAWRTLPVLQNPREIVAWNRDGELLRLWGRPTTAGMCKHIRSTPLVEDTASTHGLYSFAYACECENDHDTTVVPLF